jgi:broad-specificity NMP kinase
MDAKKTAPHQSVNRMLVDYAFLSLVEQHLIHSPALTEDNEQIVMLRTTKATMNMRLQARALNE